MTVAVPTADVASIRSSITARAKSAGTVSGFLKVEKLQYGTSTTPVQYRLTGGQVQRAVIRLLAGEAFAYEFEDGTVYIRHAEWSLMGMGDSELSAEQDLRDEARDLHDVMMSLPRHSLSHSALRLQDFLLRLL